MGDIDFTDTDLLDELSAYVVPPRQPGDVSLKDIMDQYHKTYDQARTLFRKMIDEGKAMKLEVLDEAGRKIVVLRKKANT